jgi:hypothetical protein
LATKIPPPVRFAPPRLMVPANCPAAKTLLFWSVAIAVNVWSFTSPKRCANTVFPYLSSLTSNASNPPAEISDVPPKSAPPASPPPKRTSPRLSTAIASGSCWLPAEPKSMAQVSDPASTLPVELLDVVELLDDVERAPPVPPIPVVLELAFVPPVPVVEEELVVVEVALGAPPVDAAPPVVSPVESIVPKTLHAGTAAAAPVSTQTVRHFIRTSPPRPEGTAPIVTRAGAARGKSITISSWGLP